jgi:hypothetical protein
LKWVLNIRLQVDRVFAADEVAQPVASHMQNPVFEL